VCTFLAFISAEKSIKEMVILRLLLREKKETLILMKQRKSPLIISSLKLNVIMSRETLLKS